MVLIGSVLSGREGYGESVAGLGLFREFISNDETRLTEEQFSKFVVWLKNPRDTLLRKSLTFFLRLLHFHVGVWQGLA